MQSQVVSHRRRGVRESRKLLTTITGALSDHTEVMGELIASQVIVDSLAPSMESLLITQVSQLQHLRHQLAFRLRDDS